MTSTTSGWPRAVARLVGHRVVDGRVEGPPSGSIRSRPSRSSVSNERRQICLTSSPPPWAMARSAVSKHRQQLLDEGLGRPFEMVGLLADHALLVVLEVGLQAAQGVEVVVALLGQRWASSRSSSRSRRRPRRPRWQASVLGADRRGGGPAPRPPAGFGVGSAVGLPGGRPGPPAGAPSGSSKSRHALMPRARRRSRRPRPRRRWPPPPAPPLTRPPAAGAAAGAGRGRPARRAACRAPGRRSPASRWPP